LNQHETDQTTGTCIHGSSFYIQMLSTVVDRSFKYKLRL